MGGSNSQQFTKNAGGDTRKADIGQLSLRQVRYFVAVAQCGSFTAAAKQLHVSQPALGLQVKQLETAIGAALLVRHARGVALTEAGKAFFPDAVGAIEALSRGQRSVRALTKPKFQDVSLGLTPTPGRALVADLLRACAEAAPHLRLVLREGLTDELWGLVTRGDIDGALCYDPESHESICIVPLFREDLFLVGPPALVDSSLGDVELTSIGKIPLVLGYRYHLTRRFIETVVSKSGIDLQAVMEVEPITLKRELLVRHQRCSIVPFGLFWDDLKAGLLRARRIQPPISRTAALIFKRGLPHSISEFLLTTVGALVERRIREQELGWRAV